MPEFTILEQILIYIISSAIAGGMASFITVKVLQNDIQWIKKILDTHDERIFKLEGTL